MDANCERQAVIFKALGDPKRLMIVRMLAQKEMCACKILKFFDMSQSTLSHHMKILCESGLVHAAPVGKWMHYSLNAEVWKESERFFSEMGDVETSFQKECTCSR
jgi:ArsR family transcriptional regulator